MSPIRLISRLLDDEDPLRIYPYGGFANANHILALARIMEDEGIDETFEGKGFRNIWNSLRRFETDERPDIRARAYWEGNQGEMISDAEGYLLLDQTFCAEEPGAETTFRPIRFEMAHEGLPEYQVPSSYMVPSSQAQFGIISDIDDTILETGVLSPLKLKLFINSITRSSFHRKSFPLTREFYVQLQEGTHGKRVNPFFYLSNSPWNIYYYLETFMGRMEFPAGVILLRDIGRPHGVNVPYLTDSKETRAEMIFQMYPLMPFVLIGDAAEADAAIYSMLAEKFPAQVKAILIRKVVSRKRNERVHELLKTAGRIPFIVYGSIDEAKEFAASHGLIR